MEARICSPRKGSAALCAAITLCSLNVATAQFGPLADYGQPTLGQPQARQPVFGQRGLSPRGVVQPVVQGMPSRQPVYVGNNGAPRAFQGQAQAPGGVGQSENFVVLCYDQNLARDVSQEAEKLRRELAIYWLGYELPPWSRRCPLQVTSGPQLGAGGETRFSLYNGNVGEWNMSVQGTPERILDSVLPHEITHTIFASHFAPLNTHVPRWADEGACTTVEHDSEQSKHKAYLVRFLTTGRGMSFNRMFSLKDYPDDILPLYAQGHSVVEFLISQGGPRKFVQFLEQGMKSQRWEPAIADHYGYKTLGQLQGRWNQWIADGRGAVDKYVANPGSSAATVASLASKSVPAKAAADDVGVPSADNESVEEGASVSLASYSNLAAKGSVKPAALAADGAPGEVNLIAASARPKATLSDAGKESDGFYRQRLESNLRDIVRVHPAASSKEMAVEPTMQARALDAKQSQSAAIYR